MASLAGEVWNWALRVNMRARSRFGRAAVDEEQVQPDEGVAEGSGGLEADWSYWDAPIVEWV
jgi:hypothetical protein